MSDVDTTEGQEVAIQGAEPQTVSDPVAEAIASTNPPGVAVYPENDVVRAALSGVPAGNTDEMPPGTDEVRAAMADSLAPPEGEGTPAGAKMQLQPTSPNSKAKDDLD